MLAYYFIFILIGIVIVVYTFDDLMRDDDTNEYIWKTWFRDKKTGIYVWEDRFSDKNKRKM